MTDFTKLIDDAVGCSRQIGITEAKRAHGNFTQDDSRFLTAMYRAKEKHVTALQSAIEALQGEVERLDHETADLAMLADQYKAERDKLQAKLDELQRQEPVAWRYVPSKVWGDFVLTDDPKKVRIASGHGVKVDPLYAAPKALEPLTDCRIELVTAIHTLASHYENRLHRLDADDRKLAESDIAHAIKIASKWNWNGITKGTP